MRHMRLLDRNTETALSSPVAPTRPERLRQMLRVLINSGEIQINEVVRPLHPLLLFYYLSLQGHSFAQTYLMI